MPSQTDVFFDELNRRGHEPALRNRTATVRFDVVHGKNTDRWIVAIDKGDITVSQGEQPADCVLRADQKLFDAMVSGKTNPMAAMLRGALLAEGDPELLVAARRLLPPHPLPDPATDSQPATSATRRKR